MVSIPNIHIQEDIFQFNENSCVCMSEKYCLISLLNFMRLKFKNND